ncbi:adenylate/guanylate cyclase domain-containing protein [Hongsoonwoonella zoysiae]|uniref:adenylate/guanylate cyclase domain-containing protein n=1 Tax=Hongsoonwoonella zoysiae TaxID=2821844 RepID=UPI001FE741EF|nr:adenylate/guanylate cyclase domain-containing protein [Hongsoonwoonella zoysiae]
MTNADALQKDAASFGLLAYGGAAISLMFCFWSAVIQTAAPLLGLSVIGINPHVQAVFMWFFSAAAVAGLLLDKKRHGILLPSVLGILAFIVILGTLYTYYDPAILASGYVLLLAAAFLNRNQMLIFLKRKVEAQAKELAEVNMALESRVSSQVRQIEKLARLKRFLPSEVADLVLAEGKESMLESHRRYIACVFCDIRRFSAMTESMEPEDLMDVLRSFHEEVGRLAVKHGGTIGFRAGDGVMIFFNDPIPCEDPDGRAVHMAFDIKSAFAGLSERWAKLGMEFGIGIGVASGYATMGIIGVEGRYDYTPIGNAVNLAARLSDHAQDGEILVSRRTFAEIEHCAEARALGDVPLKGLSQPAEIYALEALPGAAAAPGGEKSSSTVDL